MSAAVAAPTPGSRLARWWEAYWYEPMDRGRMRWFARIVYATLLVVVWFVDDYVVAHEWAPRAFWQPVWVARVLSIPPPTPTTMTLLRVVLTGSILAAIALARPVDTPRARLAARSANLVVLLSFSLWVIWSFSWSKVDHDRMTMMVALAVLVVVPGVGTGVDRLVGWALRTVQVVFVLAYPLSAVSKFQKTGWDWANRATFARAIIRRGTWLGSHLAEHGMLLRVSQWGFVIFEVVSIVALSRNRRIRMLVLPGFFFLHFFTWLAIGIHFLPHTICLTAFLPLERIPVVWARLRAWLRDRLGAGRGQRRGAQVAGAEPTTVT